MEEQDLRHIWKQSSENSEITINTQQLFKNFKTRMEHREHIVRKRDRREIIGAIFGIFGFSVFTIDLWFSIAALGMLSIALSFCYYIYRLHSNRKSKYTKDLFLSIKEQLLHQKQFMLNQVKLLDTVVYWAVLPIFTGYMIAIWSIWNLDGYNFSSFMMSIYPEELKSKVIFTLVIGVSFIYGVWINKKAVKVNWKPLMKQIDDILEELKKEK